MSSLARLRAKPGPLPIALLVCLGVVVFAVWERVVAIGAPSLLTVTPVPTPAEAKQALMDLLEQPAANGNIVDPSLRSSLADLRKGKAMAIVGDDRRSGESTWTFNCNLNNRMFSFYAAKTHGCSFHWVGEFVHSNGKWSVQNLHWDSVACAR
jgi:hypothetical protein